MRLLLDTHLLIWAAQSPRQLSAGARALMADPANRLHFSVASLWEVVIKSGLGRFHFQIDVAIFRDDLLQGGYDEVTVSGLHALAVAALPLLHKDPFDRLLLAQAVVENMTLLTADAALARYPGPVRLV